MKQIKNAAVVGFLCVLTVGSLAHFLYGWSGNNRIVGLFAPVNESVWEHMKLLFFPMLAYSLYMILRFRKDHPGITSAFCLGILAGTILIPVFFYAYTCVLGRNLFFLDISTFILSILIAFRIAYGLTLSGRARPYTPLLLVLVCVLAVCFAVFTCRPP